MEKALEQLDLMTKMWTDFAGRMASAGFSVQPGSAPPEMAKQMRNAFLQAMGQSLDEYMRSPQFLQMMKQSVDAAIAWRKQFNDVLTNWRHELQGTTSQDVDNVMLALRQMETRILDRVEEVARRLDDVTAKLAGQPQSPAAGNGAGELKRPAADAPRKTPKGS